MATANPTLDDSSTKTADNIVQWAKRQAIGQVDLSFGARECWRLLEGFPLGACYPSHFFIAERLRKSVSAVRRYLKELERNGYLRITEQYDDDVRHPRGHPRVRRFRSATPRGQTSNAYTLLDQPDLVARTKQIIQEWTAKSQKAKG